MDIFEYLYQQRFKKGIVPSLDRLLPIYHSYQLNLSPQKIIHVAGTNGKGSTIAFIRSILEAGGYSVGIFTSPHLYDVTERFYCHGSDIDRDDLVAILTELKDRVDRYQQNYPFHFITFFEYMTLAGLIWFAQQQPDFILLEVGMGGRFDATNIVDAAYSVVTTIGLDHVSYLGHTLEKIAFEKGGIIKSGQQVVLGEIESGPKAVLHDQINSVGASLHHYQSDLNSFTSGLKGDYQRENLTTALSVIDLLDLNINRDMIAQGVSDTRWAGRYELLSKDPIVLRDVAHNVMGMNALKNALNYDYSDIPKIVVFGVMQDKDLEGITDILNSFATELYFVQLPFPRSATINHIKSLVTCSIVDISPEDSVQVAQKRAIELNGMVVVTGSIYLMEYL